MAQMNNPKGRKLGIYGEDTCPRCGAPRSVQRHPLRRNIVDFSQIQLMDNLHPSDGITCKVCGLSFRVAALDVDEGYLLSDDELECVPNYCPQCGEVLFADGGIGKAVHDG